MDVDATTKQDNKKDMNLNPTGKGGFGDNPQNRNPGGRPRNSQRYDYWLQFFKDMTVADFEAYTKTRPRGEMYMAERQALTYLTKSDKDFNIFKVIADRTEGRAQQSIDHTNDGDKFENGQIVGYVLPSLTVPEPQNDEE